MQVVSTGDAVRHHKNFLAAGRELVKFLSPPAARHGDRRGRGNRTDCLGEGTGAVARNDFLTLAFARLA